MTLIIGIVGSPRKDELTSQLVDAALSGATVKIVFNHDNAIDKAVKQAAPVLKKK